LARRNTKQITEKNHSNQYTNRPYSKTNINSANGGDADNGGIGIGVVAEVDGDADEELAPLVLDLNFQAGCCRQRPVTIMTMTLRILLQPADFFRRKLHGTLNAGTKLPW
jgi:hypothetical protein